MWPLMLLPCSPSLPSQSPYPVFPVFISSLLISISSLSCPPFLFSLNCSPGLRCPGHYNWGSLTICPITENVLEIFKETSLLISVPIMTALLFLLLLLLLLLSLLLNAISLFITLLGYVQTQWRVAWSFFLSHSAIITVLWTCLMCLLILSMLSLTLSSRAVCVRLILNCTVRISIKNTIFHSQLLGPGRCTI